MSSTAGLAYSGNKEYILKSLEVAGGDSYDIMNFHVYPFPNQPEIRLNECITVLKDAMEIRGGQKPIWLTEIGSSTPLLPQSAPILVEAAKLLNVKPKTVYVISSFSSDPKKIAQDMFPETKKNQADKFLPPYPNWSPTQF